MCWELGTTKVSHNWGLCGFNGISCQSVYHAAHQVALANQVIFLSLQSWYCCSCGLRDVGDAAQLLPLHWALALNMFKKHKFLCVCTTSEHKFASCAQGAVPGSAMTETEENSDNSFAAKRNPGDLRCLNSWPSPSPQDPGGHSLHTTQPRRWRCTRSWGGV